jgi:hypothetical protein
LFRYHHHLKSEEEAINAGVEDALQQGDLCLVEWPEKAPDLLPDDVSASTTDWNCLARIDGNHHGLELAEPLYAGSGVFL